jgi:hypothetical protein
MTGQFPATGNLRWQELLSQEEIRTWVHRQQLQSVYQKNLLSRVCIGSYFRRLARGRLRMPHAMSVKLERSVSACLSISGWSATVLTKRGAKKA